VTGLTNITVISAGNSHNLALKSDGTVWSWGQNSEGQLGDGTYTDSPIPTQISGLTNVKTVAAGGHHCIASKINGTVWTWGLNAFGQLGDGTNVWKAIPAQVPNLTGITTVFAGTHYNFVFGSDGIICGWGYNGNAQLGDGTFIDRITPVSVIGTTLTPTGTAVSITKNITVNADFIVMCSLDNITSFNGDTFKITYDPVKVTLIDFAAQTPALDVSVGIVPGTNSELEILAHDPLTGVLTFAIDKTIPSGQMWSGAVTILKFRGNITGTVTIEFEQT